MNLLKISDINENKLERIFEFADKARSENILSSKKLFSAANDKFLANIFLEPSTRTRLSFDASMKYIGGKVLTIENGASSSMEKGESLSDTIRTVSQYSHIVVVRTSEELNDYTLGDINTPIINAGDGSKEHPTQALLDFYTIRKKIKKEDFSILFLGDVKYSRTAHSLIHLLSNYNCKMYRRSPNVNLPADLKKLTEDAEDNWIKRILPNVDVVYCIRRQKERYSKVPTTLAALDEFKRYDREYGLFNVEPNVLKDSAIVMHPMPRGPELPVSYDKDHRSVYFEQSKNGIYVRIGILMEYLQLQELV